LVDAKGVPLAVVVDGANEHDMTLFGRTLDALDELPVERPKPTATKPQGLCLDKGYDYPIVRELCELCHLVAHIRPRGEEAQDIKRKPGYKARRWVVERTHSWLNRFRRILIRWEKDDLYHLGMLNFACGIIVHQQTGLFG
jgi:putative transposase